MATKRVRQSLVLTKVAEEEGIEVTEEEIDGEIEAMAEGVGERGEELKKQFNSPPVRQSLKDVIVTRKTVKRLLEIASGKAESTGEKGEEDATKRHNTHGNRE